MSVTDVDRYRVGWVAVGVVLAIVVGLVLAAFIGTVVFGVFLYYATRPVHRRIRRYVGQPTVAAILSLLAMALPVVVLVAYAVAIALKELKAVLADVDLGPFAGALDPYLDLSTVVDQPSVLLQRFGDPEGIAQVASSVISSLSAVLSGLLYLFVAFAIAFYLLRDGDRLGDYVAAVDDDRRVVIAYWEAVDESLRDIFFGNILTVLLTGAIAAISYSAVNFVAPSAFAIPYPALIGIFAGVASLIPLVGMKIVYVPLVLYLGGRAALAGTGWEFVAIVAGVSLVVIDLIPDILLRPYVSGGTVHTGSLMFAYILGPIAFGWYGLFLGPLVLALASQFVRFVLPELLAGEPLDARPVDPERYATAPATATQSDATGRPPSRAEAKPFDGETESAEESGNRETSEEQENGDTTDGTPGETEEPDPESE